tara:strand:- start:15326 stop:15508 length:183 start_codon:yes stop_codon:yes gene_type:complete
MIDGVIIVAIMIPVLIGICQMMFTIINGEGGTKGISKEAYYGRKTGKVYTAEKCRENHIV